MKKMILAQDTYTNLTDNVLLVGSSGTGKSEKFILPNLLMMNCNYVIVDTNNDLLKETGGVLKDNGYTIKFFNLKNIKHSNTYNPLYYIENDVDVFDFIDCLFDSTNIEVKKHYEDCERALLSSLILYLKKYRPENEQTLESVCKLLRATSNDGYKSPLDRIFGELETRDPDSIALKQYKTFKLASDTIQNNVIYITSSRLQYFNFEEYQNLTNTNNIDFYDIQNEKFAIFVVLPENESSKNFLFNVFFSQLNSFIFKDHTKFIINGGTYNKINHFSSWFSSLKNNNKSSILVIQDEEQLEECFGNDYNNIISKCQQYVFFGSSNMKACDKFIMRTKYAIDSDSIKRMKNEFCAIYSDEQFKTCKKIVPNTFPSVSREYDSYADFFFNTKKENRITKKVNNLKIIFDNINAQPEPTVKELEESDLHLESIKEESKKDRAKNVPVDVETFFDDTDYLK